MSEKQNPLVDDLVESKTMPPVSIELPTRGMWYLPDENILHPDVDVKNIEVRVLNVMAEINYRDPYLLLSGGALPKMLKHICPEILRPEELCDLDIEAILIAARIASYGSKMTLEHTCSQLVNPKPKKGRGPSKSDLDVDGTAMCGHANRILVDLLNFINRYQPLTDEDLNKYELFLDRFGQKVCLRPIAYGQGFSVMKKAIVTGNMMNEFENAGTDAGALLVEMDKVEKYSNIVDSTTEATIDAITGCIHCVYTRKEKPVYSSDSIRKWLLMIPIEEVNMIRKRINENAIKLHALSELSYTCDGCKKENKLSLQMDPQRLFGKGEVSTMPKKPSPRSVGTGTSGKVPSKVLRR